MDVSLSRQPPTWSRCSKSFSRPASRKWFTLPVSPRRRSIAICAKGETAIDFLLVLQNVLILVQSKLYGDSFSRTSADALPKTLENLGEVQGHPMAHWQSSRFSREVGASRVSGASGGGVCSPRADGRYTAGRGRHAR